MQLRLRGRRSAQAVPMLALVLLLLIGFAGLAVDGALAFAWRRNTMNAADGAALMGTRALIAARRSGSADDIADTVRDYLREQLGVDDPGFAAYYVDGSGQRDSEPIGGPDKPPESVRGVSVDVRYTFSTYLMSIFGMGTLTVDGRATARFGNAGTVFGPDLVPMGVNQTAAAIIREPANRPAGVRIDVDGYLERHNEELRERWAGDKDYVEGTDPPYPDWVDPRTFVTEDQVRSVRLRHGYALPELGSHSECDDMSAVEDTLQYWWCYGSPHPMHVGDPFAESWDLLVQDLIGIAPVDTSLVDRDWMGTRHNTVFVIPVYAEVPIIPDDAPSGVSEAYVIDHFMAVRLQALNYPHAWIRLEYLGTYTTAGGLVGTNNNVDRGDPCEVCTVNLVRDVP